ncbi:MAG: sulfite exporter TauE/SafE family protein [Chloroflexota bacterium]|nr:sulfite exporter TauE/SafE family protein [Chloroflexota bacterium]
MNASVTQIIIILVAGLVAGFVNTMAGGGSFLTIAALELTGLPIIMANGTNRVAVEVQTIMAILGFRSKGISDAKLSIQFAIPALLGAVLGAYLVIDLPTTIFRRFMAVAMLMMLVILVIRPTRWFKERQIEMTPKRKLLGAVALFVVGIYGGAIQAGVGFLLIASLVVVAGLNLVQANSHKVFIIATYTLFALGTFALKGQVNWILGLILAVGNGVGGWLASRLAVEKGEGLVRAVLGIMLAVLSIRYLGLIPGF